MLICTLGDPLSINVELAYYCLQAEPINKLMDSGIPIVMIGSLDHWQDQVKRLGFSPLRFNLTNSFKELRIDAINFLNIETQKAFAPAETLDPFARGQYAVSALEILKTIDHSSQKLLAVITAPIDKYAASLAGFRFPGQTEFFEALWGSQAVMTLAGPRLRVGLVTNHLPLSRVPSTLSIELIEKKLSALIATMQRFFGIENPRIAVCGLNPHASDHGLFGDEEKLKILPAIESVRRQTNAEIYGPIAADTVFYRCYHGAFDAVLAMYHDQGLGPLKALHFDEAVNLSGGLPYLRVSPDHGPARDLFMRKSASPQSFWNAFEIAYRYLTRTMP